MLRRDSDLRLRTLPPLATVVAVVAFGLATGQLASPFTGTPATAALSLAAVQLVVLAVPVMLYNLLSSRDHAASWLLAVAPSGASGLPARAARAAVCYGVALPARCRRKKVRTSALNSLWNATRSKPSASRQILGTALASSGEQGARNAKWPALRASRSSGRTANF